MISFFSRLTDLISPRACPVCGMRMTVTEETLCASCNRHLPRTFFWEHPLDNEMAQTCWIQIPVEKAAALFFYEAQSEASRLIYQMKYKGHPEIGEQLGKMAAEEMKGSGFFEDIDVLVPWGTESTQVYSEVLISDTVLLGQVPQTFLQYEGNEG
jgi:predicted amidophosphoribosyltransferase